MQKIEEIPLAILSRILAQSYIIQEGLRMIVLVSLIVLLRGFHDFCMVPTSQLNVFFALVYILQYCKPMHYMLSCVFILYLCPCMCLCVCVFKELVWCGFVSPEGY